MATGTDTVIKIFAPIPSTGAGQAPRAAGLRRIVAALTPVAVALGVAACVGGGLDTGSLTIPSVAMPKVDLPKVDVTNISLPKVELPEAAHPVVGTPTEVYTRVAQGAVTCWFGAHGPLKGRYIYFASAESPSRGGRAEIAVHERDDVAKDPRGGRALKIFITAEGAQTVVSYENQRISTELSEAMRRDVDRWAGGKSGCEPIPHQTAWNAETQRPPGKKTEPAKPPQSKAKAAQTAATAAARR